MNALADDDTAADDLIEQIKGIKLEQFLVATTASLASLAYAKLDAADLPEARLAIDAVAALAPLLDGDAKRDLGQTLSNLQLAYADVVAATARPTE